MTSPTLTYGIAELADKGGVSRRTVRYYVRRGLLPAPTGTGRGKHYTQAHLRVLVQIRELQEAGVTLAEIQRRLQAESPPGNSPGTSPGNPTSARASNATGDTAANVTPAPTAYLPPRVDAADAVARSVWTRVRVADGVELHIESVRRPDDRTLARVADAVQQILSAGVSSADRAGDAGTDNQADDSRANDNRETEYE